MDILKENIRTLLEEDDLGKNSFYFTQLPSGPVKCELRIKSDCILSGLPFFMKVFDVLGAKIEDSIWKELEGKKYSNKDVILKDLVLPFDIALTGERLALNLLQKSTSISTLTNKFTEKVSDFNVAVLDTRKTTPGLRWLEKYAVVVGGGKNHRLGQVDLWMVKDNHKEFFGGVKEAIDFFRKMNGFYTPILLEVHNEAELVAGLDYGVKHFMLDNFAPADISKLLKHKTVGVTFEVSGGIDLDSIQSYCVEGVDAISIGALTHSAPTIDLSFKYGKA